MEKNRANSEELKEDLKPSEEEKREYQQLWREIQKTKFPEIPSWIKYLAITYALIAFSALGVLVAVQIRDVDISTRVYGPTILPQQFTLNYRLAVFNPIKNSFYSQIRGKISLLSPDGKRKLLAEGESRGEALTLQIRVPNWPVGSQYHLLIETTCKNGRDKIKLPVKIVKKLPFYPIQFEKLAPYWIFYPEKEGAEPPFEVILFSESRGIVADLPNWLWISIQKRERRDSKNQKALKWPPSPSSKPSERNQKLQAQSQRKDQIEKKSPKLRPKSEQLGGDSSNPASRPKDFSSSISEYQVYIQIGRDKKLGPFRPSEGGIVRFSEVPLLFEETWTVELISPRGERYRFIRKIKPRGYQLKLFLDKVSYRPGETVRGEVRYLSERGELFTDLTKHGLRLYSFESQIEGSKARLSFKLPAEVRGIVGLQVYTEFYFPSDVYDVRPIYIGPQNKEEFLKAVRRHLKESGERDRLLELDQLLKNLSGKSSLEELARPIFGILKYPFSPPRLAHDSFRERLRKLRLYQAQFRDQTILFLAIVSLLAIGILLSWLIYQQYQREKLLQQELRELLSKDGTSTEGEEEPLQTPHYMAVTIIYFIILLAIIAAILYLFWSMKWTYDI